MSFRNQYIKTPSMNPQFCAPPTWTSAVPLWEAQEAVVSTFMLLQLYVMYILGMIYSLLEEDIKVKAISMVTMSVDYVHNHLE